MLAINIFNIIEPMKNTWVVLKNAANGSELPARKIAFKTTGDGIEIRQTCLKYFTARNCKTR